MATKKLATKRKIIKKKVVPKNPMGDLIQAMVGSLPDDVVAATLNRSLTDAITSAVRNVNHNTLRQPIERILKAKCNEVIKSKQFEEELNKIAEIIVKKALSNLVSG